MSKWGTLWDFLAKALLRFFSRRDAKTQGALLRFFDRIYSLCVSTKNKPQQSQSC